MRRRALCALPLALLLISAPGASADTCTASASGAWTAAGTWSCRAVPGPADAVVIPAGKTVSVADDEQPSAASVTLLGGTLALGDSSQLDDRDFAAPAAARSADRSTRCSRSPLDGGGTGDDRRRRA